MTECKTIEDRKRYIADTIKALDSITISKRASSTYKKVIPKEQLRLF